jgi:hypothetical protein
LGHVVKHCQDHVRLLYDLSDDMTLAQKIVLSLVLLIIKILIIKDHKLYITFLYVAFRSQSLLEPTSDQSDSDIN